MLFPACHHSHSHKEEYKHDEQVAQHEHTPGNIEMTATQVEQCGIQTAEIHASDFREITEVSGQILPATGTETTVSATMEGIIAYANTNLTEGMEVKKNTRLFTINAKNLANGNPAAAARSELEAAKKALKRAENLTADRIISQRELDNAQQRYATALAAATSLGDATQTRSITAPMEGIVKKVIAQPGDFVTMGQPLATISQTKKLQLKVELPLRLHNVAHNVETANFKLSYDNRETTYSLNDMGGRLLTKGRITNENSAFIPIIFEMNNSGDITPGTYAEVYLLGHKRSGVIAVPNEAIIEGQGLYFVFVQVGNNEFRKQEIGKGQTDGKYTEVLTGLKEGDKIVVKGAINVQLAAYSTTVPEGHSH